MKALHEDCELGGNAGNAALQCVNSSLSFLISFYFALFWFLFIAETLETSWGRSVSVVKVLCACTWCVPHRQSQSHRVFSDQHEMWSLFEEHFLQLLTLVAGGFHPGRVSFQCLPSLYQVKVSRRRLAITTWSAESIFVTEQRMHITILQRSQ